MDFIFNKKKQKGFTLIELIIVIIISAILIANSSGLIVQGFNSFIRTKDTIQNNWQNNIALEFMIRDFRAIRSYSDITAISGTSITYNDINANIINYSVNGSSQLVYTNNGVAQILADGMGSLSFSYYNSVGVGTANPSLVRYIIVNIGTQEPIATIFPWNIV